MRMRLAYAIAVLRRIPVEILIMDEWVSAVDENWLDSRNNLFEKIFIPLLR